MTILRAIGLCVLLLLCTQPAWAQLPLGQGPNIGPDPLLEAAQRGAADSVQQQLNSGADPSKVFPEGVTALIAATKNGHVEVVDLLVKNKARLEQKDNKSQNTALNWATERGHVEIVQILLDAGADPNTISRDGSTPLIKAAKGGYVEIAQMLIARKADLNRGDYSGLTALDWAERSRQPNVAKLLKQAGAK